MRGAKVTFHFTHPRQQMPPDARKKPNCASKCRQTRAGECRVAVLDPKVYKGTPRGRERQEENKNSNQKEKTARKMRTVFNLKLR